MLAAFNEKEEKDESKSDTALIADEFDDLFDIEGTTRTRNFKWTQMNLASIFALNL